LQNRPLPIRLHGRKDYSAYPLAEKNVKILLATDGSALADAALEVLLYRPWQAGAQVRVISVVEPLSERINHLVRHFGLSKAASDSRKRFIRLSTDLLESYAERLQAKFGADLVSSAVLCGRVRETLIDEATSWQANTIMLGAHGRSETGEILLGSVAEYLLTHARSSVEILKSVSPAALISEIEQKKPLAENRYLVALDDSSYNQITMDEILSRQWPARSSFKVVSVVEPTPFQAYTGLDLEEGPGSEEYQGLVKKTRDAERAAAEKVVAGAVALLQEKLADACVTGEVIEGHARDAILSSARAWTANLIIMGLQGRSGCRSQIGRISKATAVYAPCSVLVVRQHVQGKDS
jgi:nucleotide-binding universal stress UspA family protein